MQRLAFPADTAARLRFPAPTLRTCPHCGHYVRSDQTSPHALVCSRAPQTYAQRIVVGLSSGTPSLQDHK